MKQHKVELSLLHWGRWCHASGDLQERVACVFVHPMRMASVTWEGESEVREEAGCVLESPERLPWSFQHSGWWFQKIGDGQIFYWFVEIRGVRESVWWWESPNLRLSSVHSWFRMGRPTGQGQMGSHPKCPSQLSVQVGISHYCFTDLKTETPG